MRNIMMFAWTLACSDKDPESPLGADTAESASDPYCDPHGSSLTWEDECYAFTDPTPEPMDVLRSAYTTQGDKMIYGFAGDASGLFEYRLGEWLPLRLPDLGVPPDTVFPPQRLLPTRTALWFQGGESAFWWDGSTLLPASPLVGEDWLTASSATSLVSARFGTLLSEGTLQMDEGTGAWAPVPVTDAPSDGQVQAVALAGDVALVALRSTDADRQVLLAWNGAIWKEVGVVTDPVTTALEADWGERAFWAVSSMDGAQGSIWEADPDGRRPLEDLGYRGAAVIEVSQSAEHVTALDDSGTVWVYGSQAWNRAANTSLSAARATWSDAGIRLHYDTGMWTFECEYGD